MRSKLIIVALVMYSMSIQAQKIPLLLDSNLGSVLKIDNYVEVFHDSLNKNLLLEDVRKQQFVDFEKYRRNSQFFKEVLWLHFKVKNTNHFDTLSLIFSCGAAIKLKIYEIDDTKNVQIVEAGWRSNRTENINAIYLHLLPNHTYEYYIQKTNYVLLGQLETKLYNPILYELELKNNFYQYRYAMFFYCLIIGVCCFLMITTIVQFVITKDRTLIWWGIYLLGVTLYFLRFFENLSQIKIISIYWQDFFLVSIPIIDFLMSGVYFLFVLDFLKIKKYSPKTYAIFRKIAYISLFLSSLCLFISFSGDRFESTFLFLFKLKYLILIIIMTFCFNLLRLKIPLYKWMLYGTIMLVLGALVATILNRYDFVDFKSFWLTPSVYYGFGVLTELLIYSLALSQRSHLIEIENQSLKNIYTQELENELSKQLIKINDNNKLIENQKIAQITSEFQQKIAETEITALRSQMNPHFIFNCLNSIKLYSLENDSQSASDYLTKFSRLIRLVLENSRSEKVTLENELETLKLYIEMEAMRFKDKVKYQINIASNIDQQFIEIPPLLIQPFVENSIWHGLMHKSEGGTVKIDVSQPKEQVLHIEISDDGIGREKAQAYKSKSAMKQKSFGMKVTSERIELINQIYKTNTEVEIIDLKDQNQEAIGTKVMLNIPI